MLPSTGSFTHERHHPDPGLLSHNLGLVRHRDGGVSFALLTLVTLLLLRSRRERALEAAVADERAREMDDKVTAINQPQDIVI
jgi:DNA recombination protein RmuC